MKKVIIVFLSVFILFVSLPFFSSATITSQVSEPKASDSIKVFVLYNHAETVGRIYYFIAGVSSDYKNTFSVNFYCGQNDTWKYSATYRRYSNDTTYTLADYTILQYDLLDGHFYYCYSRESAKVYNTSFTTAEYDHYISYDVDLSPLYTGNQSSALPQLGSVNWAQNIDYTQDIAALNALLTHISTRSDFISTELDQLWTLISQNWAWLKVTYYNTITGRWNLTNQKLDEIISLLGGGETAPTFEDHAADASQVDDYVSQENQYMEQFGSNVDDFGNTIDQAGFNLGTLTNGFAAVKLFFENFVFGFNLPYMIIFFSLVFGVFILILGKKVH